MCSCHYLFVFFNILILICDYSLAYNNYKNQTDSDESSLERKNATHHSERILSRQRRFLIFPEGSSFQLVYCLTVPTYAIQGSLFTIGITASLAWELPHDPYSVLRKKAEAIHRRKDDKTKLKPIYIKPNNKKSQKFQTKSPVQLVTKKPTSYYSKPEALLSSVPIYSPKYSWNQINENKDKIYSNNKASPKKYLYDPYLDLHGIHRRTRRDLFAKLENFIHAQRKDGRACILKFLCEVSQASNKEKGTFVEELMRIVFTWKPDPDTNDEHYKHYNKASTQLQDCSKLYPSCQNSVFKMFK